MQITNYIKLELNIHSFDAQSTSHEAVHTVVNRALRELNFEVLILERGGGVFVDGLFNVKVRCSDKCLKFNT